MTDLLIGTLKPSLAHKNHSKPYHNIVHYFRALPEVAIIDLQLLSVINE